MKHEYENAFTTVKTSTYANLEQDSKRSYAASLILRTVWPWEDLKA